MFRAYKVLEYGNRIEILITTKLITLKLPIPCIFIKAHRFITPNKCQGLINLLTPSGFFTYHNV